MTRTKNSALQRAQAAVDRGDPRGNSSVAYCTAADSRHLRLNLGTSGQMGADSGRFGARTRQPTAAGRAGCGIGRDCARSTPYLIIERWIYFRLIRVYRGFLFGAHTFACRNGRINDEWPLFYIYGSAQRKRFYDACGRVKMCLCIYSCWGWLYFFNLMGGNWQMFDLAQGSLKIVLISLV